MSLSQTNLIPQHRNKEASIMSTVPVTQHALIQRINRKLYPDDRVLKVSRGARMELDVGRYFVLNFRINGVVLRDADPEELGRDLGVLREHEHVVP